MNEEEQRCNDCERKVFCHECRWESVVIPFEIRVDLETSQRLTGDIYHEDH